MFLPKQITWNEFYNYLLEPGDVERIVVVNKRIARVYLHPGAKGIPLHRPIAPTSVRRRVSSSSSTMTSSSSRAEESWEDDTIMDIGSNSSDEARNSTLSSNNTSNIGVIRRLGDENQRPQQLVYHFQIGSVESFEEKLSKAQQELGISSRDFVPVCI